MFEEELANPELGEETETPTVPPTEEKTDEPENGSQPEPIAQENIPYHKDPRWIEMHSKAKRVDELEERLAELDEWKAQQESSKQSQPQQIPDWFKRLYGEDEENWRAYSESTRNEKEAWKQELREELKQEQQAQTESLKRGEEWINDQLADLRDQGIAFDENELVKVVVDYQIFDKDGNPNFQAGLRFLEATKQAPVNPNKKIASMTAGKGSDPGNKSYSTSEELRNADWNELID